MIPRILLLAALVAAPFTMAASLGGAFSVGVCGNLPCGSAIDTEPDGATPVFDTGDPTTETWGPTAFLDAGDFAGGSVHYAFVGQDAVSGSHTWPEHYGSITLTGGNTGALTYDVATPFTDGTLGVKGTGNESTQGYFVNSSATDVDGSGNYIWIWVGKGQWSNVGADHIMVLEGGTGADLRIRTSGTGVCQPTYNSSAGQEVLNAGCTEDAWCVCIAITTPDSSFPGHMYEQGLETDNEPNAPLTNTDATVLGIHSDQAGSTGDIGPITTAAVIVIDGHTLADEAASHAWADEAAQRIMGSYLDTGGAASTHTRASTSYLRVCDPTANATTYFPVDDNWPRREVSCGYTWTNPTSSETTVAAFIQEGAATNIVDFGNGLDDASWTKINSATVTADQQNDPAGDATLDNINGVAASGEHGVSQAQTLTAASYTLSAVYKPGNQTFAYMDVSSIANVSAYWDSTDCQPDTVGSAATAYGYDLGDLCYLYLVYTGTAASHTHRLLCAEADNDKDYAGASGDCAYGWVGVTQTGHPRSPVLTVDATNVTRSADALDYTLSAITGPTTLISDATIPNVSATIYQGMLWDGTTDNRHLLWANAANSRHFLEANNVNQINYNSGPDIVDGSRHIARGTTEAGGGAWYVDGTLDTTHSVVTEIIGANELFVGQSNTGLQHGGPIYRFLVYDSAIAPGEQGTGDDVP